MYKIDRWGGAGGGGQKSYTRTDPTICIRLSFVFEKNLLKVKALSFYLTTPIFVKTAFQESYLILFITKNEISVIHMISSNKARTKNYYLMLNEM